MTFFFRMWKIPANLFGLLCYGGATAAITAAVARRSFRRTRAVKAKAECVQWFLWKMVIDILRMIGHELSRLLPAMRRNVAPMYISHTDFPPPTRFRVTLLAG